MVRGLPRILKGLMAPRKQNNAEQREEQVAVIEAIGLAQTSLGHPAALPPCVHSMASPSPKMSLTTVA